MTTTTLNIQGMTCGGCVNSVKRALANLPGVGQTDVSLEKGQATIEYDPAQVSPEQLKHAVVDAGYDVPA
ncbi:MAG: heavy-metal-associated domain-containing protein [Betaproteobacteria bacterium]|nr:heavy-metal-associated domain-containing protein [Betaproteobacteria bacterium]MDE1981477.1 heavy-metal-associated domain-containing protein [Betaproteobacteria bacterium]MDE2624378.1 heavy-metal-associated domain-containing protein [Betaproteobacteria bacterium]